MDSPVFDDGEFISTYGEIFNFDNNLLNRTMLEEIDKHQMAIYKIMKSAYPEMVGYKAIAIEHGDGDVLTQFYMTKVNEN